MEAKEGKEKGGWAGDPGIMEKEQIIPLKQLSRQAATLDDLRKEFERDPKIKRQDSADYSLMVFQ